MGSVVLEEDSRNEAVGCMARERFWRDTAEPRSGIKMAARTTEGMKLELPRPTAATSPCGCWNLDICGV